MLRKWFFNLIYFQKPVWDTGISPPELLAFIANHQPGKALDLGCGTGTNVITLSKAGWQAIGVDFAFRAIQIARKKARRSGTEVTFVWDDVTRLKKISGSFDLILDIGCFHALPAHQQEIYIANVNRRLAPHGTYLLYSFFKEQSVIPGPGVTETAIDHLTRSIQLIDRQNGTDRNIRPSAWFTFQKDSP
jgi:SAM-dependent methyltransferase